METKMDARRIVQIGILAHDVRKTAKKWADFLQVEVPEIEVSPGYEKSQAVYRGKPCHALLYQAFFDFDNIQVEIIQPADDTPSIWRECLDRDGEGLHHISFGVKNMAGNIEKCEELGMPVLQKGEYPNGRYAYLDALGSLKVILELLEDDD